MYPSCVTVLYKRVIKARGLTAAVQVKMQGMQLHVQLLWAVGAPCGARRGQLSAWTQTREVASPRSDEYLVPYVDMFASETVVTRAFALFSIIPPPP